MNYIDQVLERAEKATEGPWSNKDRYNGKYGIVAEETDTLGPLTICSLNSNFPEYAEKNSEFIARARTDVPELARRLKRACVELRRCADELGKYKGKQINKLNISNLVDEIEAMPEERKE